MSTALYRFYGASDVLLYVGITNHLPTRLRNHATNQPWWTDVAGVTVEHFTDRGLALDAEQHAIRSEVPLHNRTHQASAAPSVRRGGRSIVRVNGERLRVIRKLSGFGGSRFAESVGISPQHLSDIERGKRNPSREVATAIAESLDVTIGVLA